MDIPAFVSMLKRLPSYPGAFNPWNDVDPDNDRNRSCPAIRRRQLACFLKSRLEKASHLIIGEASGYQGCHFTGIPMTSERILLGEMAGRGIRPADILPCYKPQRTSRPEIRPAGFSEPTATMVWEAVLRSGSDATRVCVWNTVPQHLYDPSRGLLSNRNPSKKEISEGEMTLRAFLWLFPKASVIAMGNAAARALEHLDIPFAKVRHPSQGGSTLFREQIGRLL